MSKTTKIIIGAIVAIIVIGGVWYIVNQKLISKEKELIKIGVIFPLTGFLANVGEDAMRAVETAYINLGADKDVELIFEDDACDAMKSITAYKKLTNIDKVDFIIGPFCGQSAISVLPSLNQDKVVAISPGAPDNELSKADDYFFRTRVSNKAETKKLIDFLIERGITRVAIYTAKNTFGESYKNSFVEQFSARGGEIIFSDGSIDYQTDFKTDILKIKSKNPEAIFLVPASRQQMGIFVKQMKELDFPLLVLGASVTEQQDLLNAAENSADGIIYPYVMPVQQSIFNQFLEKYGKQPSMEVLNSYDAFNVLYAKITECIGEKECVKNKLDNLKDFEGAMGNISFDEFGDSQVSLVLKTIKNGEFVPYEE